VYLKVNDNYDYDDGVDDYGNNNNNNNYYNYNNNNARFTIIHTLISLSEKMNTASCFI
jgi:hypothetical protein